MSRSQRLTFLGLAAVIAVAAVVILVVAGGSGGSGGEQAAAPTAAPTATAEPQEASPAATATPTAAATAAPGPLLTGATEQEIDATEGDTVRFRVKAAEDEEVHVHGYNIEKEVPAGDTIAISFKATITGIFEIEFHHSGAVLARLKVEPK
jgi:FtsP/CotA-like multicopper oxidase with cupredoxin domain